MLEFAIAAATPLNWSDLGLDPVIFSIGPVKIRWYSLAYIGGIIIGWWYLTKMIAQAGAPMARRHVDDFVFYATLGIIIGGRLGYCLLYKPDILQNPLDVFKLWEGGMAFHGGVLGVILATMWFVRAEKLSLLRVLDYVTVVYPIGHFFGRIANFINGELWGKATTQSWGMIFPDAGDLVVRHPSQLYQAGVEGIGLGLILSWLFWKTPARYQPGRLAGAGAMLMGIFRFWMELYREPDQGVQEILGLSRGQLLSVPLILFGAWLFFTAKKRCERVEAVTGGNSVA
jgi:phosphatidylglycerol---prolipoprotein diacylglyceryl transferase